MPPDMHELEPPAWPTTVADLEALQLQLGAAAPVPWALAEVRAGGPLRIAGCFVCFPRGGGGAGAAGDPGWAGAALWKDGMVVAVATTVGRAGAAYDPGHLARREGPLLESAVAALPEPPQVLLVNATGRDHPRRAGVALHLGARLGLASVGVTNRLLVAAGEPPADVLYATSPLRIGDEIVGYWLRTRPHTRPLAVHAGWRTDCETALAVVLACTRRTRTPDPLRAARRAAREARTRALGTSAPFTSAP